MYALRRQPGMNGVSFAVTIAFFYAKLTCAILNPLMSRARFPAWMPDQRDGERVYREVKRNGDHLVPEETGVAFRHGCDQIEIRDV